RAGECGGGGQCGHVCGDEDGEERRMRVRSRSCATIERGDARGEQREGDQPEIEREVGGVVVEPAHHAEYVVRAPEKGIVAERGCPSPEQGARSPGESEDGHGGGRREVVKSLAPLPTESGH